MLRDYLGALGYEIAKEELLRLFREHCTISDGFNECGEHGNGNVWADYMKQLVGRLGPFCSRFKDELKIDGTCQTYYTGMHINALTGLCDVILRAAQTYSKTRMPMHVIVLSTRIRNLLFTIPDGKDEFDAFGNGVIIICPLSHPNDIQNFLTTYTRKTIVKFDDSFSFGFRPLHGAPVRVEGRDEPVAIKIGRSNCYEQRWLALKERQRLERELEGRLQGMKAETLQMNSETQQTRNFNRRLAKMKERGILDR